MPRKKVPELSVPELEALAPERVDEPMARKITALYAQAKDAYVRRVCLCLLYDKSLAFLEVFFQEAFQTERHLDMRMLAVRGLAQFRDEQALAGPLQKIKAHLRKLAVSTPHNYQEYECLLGKNSLPYLVDRYRYVIFRETLAVVQTNYDAMPDAFKGHFTIGEDGKPIALRPPTETRRMLDDFYEAQRSPATFGVIPTKGGSP